MVLPNLFTYLFGSFPLLLNAAASSFNCFFYIQVETYQIALIGTRGLSPEVMRQGREADHLLPCSAEFKNAWSSTSTPPVCIHGVVLY
jgi:hypothetical protein